MNFIENIRIQLILTIFLLWFGNSTLLAQEFACTHVIGFSQTRGWFSDTDTFENIVIDGNWQLIWQGGAGVDQWRNPNYGGWNQNIISSCTQNSNAPDRILLTISGPYGADEGAWAEAIQETIDNIRIKYPSVQEILLQPVVGGPNHEDCFLNGTALIRASWQHKHIDNAIATLVGGDVLQGFSPEVNDCSDYVDQAGHLTAIGYENAATNIGSYYSENGNSSPVIFNGNPSGTLPSGTSDINLSVETNEIADCSYSMVADTDFNDMTPFLETSALFHSTPVTGLEDGNSYTYFVRCQDQEGNTNTIDFPIGFTIGAPSTDPVEIIIDNLDPEFATIGSWNTRTSSQYNPFNGGFRHTGAGNGNRQAIFTPNIITPGDYEVLIWYLASTIGATNTPFTVNSNGGSTTNLVNQLGQPGNGGFWLSLGVFNFAAGTSGSIVVTNDADGIALADAVRLTSVGAGSDDNVDLSGTVQDGGGTGLCAMVLASGQFMFSCNPNGPFSLTDLPRENDGTVKRQVYVAGFFPEVDVLQDSVDETVVMTRANNCPDYNPPSNPGVFPGSAGKRIDISGTVLLQDTQTPICAMVLANGQFMFTCDGSGQYALNIPLDNNGQFKLQIYADGFAPAIQVFDEFSAVNDVRMTDITECQ